MVDVKEDLILVLKWLNSGLHPTSFSNFIHLVLNDVFFTNLTTLSYKANLFISNT